MKLKKKDSTQYTLVLSKKEARSLYAKLDDMAYRGPTLDSIHLKLYNDYDLRTSS